MDISKLLNALENESNLDMMNYTSKKIKEMNLQILKELNLDEKETFNIYKKLLIYKYVDEMDDLKNGTYLRWIPIQNPDKIILNKGAIFCEMKIMENGVYLVCKNHGFKAKHFQIKFDENLKGFISDKAQLIAPETRTSAPVTILRDKDTMESTSHMGLFPCGEGAGHAGGITSAAVDGVKIAMSLLKKEKGID